MPERKGGRKAPKPDLKMYYQKDLWGGQGHQVVSSSPVNTSYPTPDPRQRSNLNVTAPSLWEPTLPLTTPQYTLFPGVESTQVRAVSSEGALDTQKFQEQVQRRGVTTLSNAELLTLVLRTGEASESIVPRLYTLLNSYSVQQLLRVDFGELCQQFDLGEAKAAQLQAVLEVARRLTLPADEDKYTIRSPFDAVNLVRPDMEFLDHEQLRVLVLNTKNQVEANLMLYQGTINTSVLRAAEIFRPAITRKSPNIIICHNHPSGDPEPSQEDISTTKQLIEAGKLLDVELIDHLIIGKNNRFTSLKERLRW